LPVKTVKHSTAIFSQNVLNLKTKLKVRFISETKISLTSSVSSSDEWLRLWSISSGTQTRHSSDSILLFYILLSLASTTPSVHDSRRYRGRGRVVNDIALLIASVATVREGEAIVVAHRLYQTASNRRCVLFRQLLICRLNVLQRTSLKLRMTG